MNKALKVLLLISLAGVVLFLGFRYFMARLYIDKVDSGANYIGGAHHKAIDIAFGEDEFFSSYQQFAHVLTPALREQCLQAPMSVRINSKVYHDLPRYRKCRLALPGDSDHLYYKYCAAWRFERCNILLLSDVIQKNEVLHDAVMQVIANPCSVFPSDEVMQKERDRFRAMPQKNADGNYNDEHGNWMRIDDYIHDKRALGCGSDKKPQYKFIYGFEGDTEDEHTNVKLIN